MADEQTTQPQEDHADASTPEATGSDHQTDNPDKGSISDSDKSDAPHDGKFSAEEVKAKVEGEIDNALGQLKSIIGVVGVFTEEAFEDAVAFIKKHGRAAK